MHIHVIYSERDLNTGVQYGMYYKCVFKTLTLACRTGVIFFACFSRTEASVRRAGSESHAREERSAKRSTCTYPRAWFAICALRLPSTFLWSPVKRNKLHRFCTSPKVKPASKTIKNHKEPWYTFDFRHFFVSGLRSSLKRDSVGEECGLIFPNSGW